MSRGVNLLRSRSAAARQIFTLQRPILSPRKIFYPAGGINHARCDDLEWAALIVARQKRRRLDSSPARNWRIYNQKNGLEAVLK
jgi:hypothetical protein